MHRIVTSRSICAICFCSALVRRWSRPVLARCSRDKQWEIRERGREGKKQETDRETERQKERERQTDRDREREREYLQP